MHLAEGTTVDAVSAVTVVPTIYISAGLLLPGMSTIIFYILETLLSSYVLGIPFISTCSSVIDWSGHTVTFSTLLVLCLPQQHAAAVKLCSLHALHKTLHKDMGDAWCCFLQPAASCLSMGDSSTLGV